VQDDKAAELSVLVDRGQGGTSLRSGEVEIMVHRRTLLDDWRGVAEPLNETEGSCRSCNSPGLVVRGSHLLALEVRFSDAATYQLSAHRFDQKNTTILFRVVGRSTVKRRSQGQISPPTISQSAP
jgi:hypothetical protein